jgi:hypothetical protein
MAIGRKGGGDILFEGLDISLSIYLKGRKPQSAVSLQEAAIGINE